MSRGGQALTFSWPAVVHARRGVQEAVRIALAAAVNELLTLHCGHVEEVPAEVAAAGSRLFGEPADLGNLCVERG